MLKLFQRKKKNNNVFSSAVFSEKIENVSNPCRGWYRVYNFNVCEEIDFSRLENDVDEDDTIALIFFDIGEKKGERLTKDEINRVCKVVDFFYECRRYAILRLAYDHEGKAMEREPAFFAQVLDHTKDVCEILQKCGPKVFVYQGLLVGKWGEMHSSRYVNKERLSAIYDELKGKQADGQFFSVRCPKQWRNIHSEDSTNINSSCTVGLFNDGMFGSATDLGTYGTESRANAGWNSGWIREEELKFQTELCKYVPNGGEAIYGEEYITGSTVGTYVDDLEKMHVTYLNRIHDPRLIEYWKKVVYSGKNEWNGKSLYEYVGAHLGYRFFIKSVEYDLESECLNIKVENRGFSNSYRKINVYVEHIWDGKRSIIPAESDLQKCDAGMELVISVKIQPVAGQFYLSAKMEPDGTVVRFANDDAEDGKVKLGSFTEFI